MQYLLRNQLTEMRGRFGEPNPPARDLVIALPERIGGEDEGEDCVICLEEFKQGDKIRILPCSHEYHSECIDRWLQTQTQQCPMCKHDVTHANEVAARSAVPTSTDVPSVHCCDCWRRSATTLSSDEHREVELELLVENAGASAEAESTSLAEPQDEEDGAETMDDNVSDVNEHSPLQ